MNINEQYFFGAMFDTAMQTAEKVLEINAMGLLGLSIAVFTGLGNNTPFIDQQTVMETPQHICAAFKERKVRSVEDIFFDDGDFTIVSKNVVNQFVNQTSARLVYLSGVINEQEKQKMQSLGPVGYYCAYALMNGVHMDVNSSIIHYFVDLSEVR